MFVTLGGSSSGISKVLAVHEGGAGIALDGWGNSFRQARHETLLQVFAVVPNCHFFLWIFIAINAHFDIRFCDKRLSISTHVKLLLSFEQELK